MSTHKTKVFVTGIGIISPAGVGIESLRKVLQEGASTASDIIGDDFFEFPVKYACQINNFNPLDYINFRFSRHMTRCSQFGVAASLLAVRDSNLDFSIISSDRIQIYEGTSMGGLHNILADYKNFLDGGYQNMNPSTSAQAFIGSTTGEIAILLGLQSRSITICSGSASASDAIGLGFEQVSSGAIDVAIVGGSEAPIVPAVVASFCRAGVVSMRNSSPQTAPRAFTADRDGFIVGEGAAFLILESERNAKARHAKIYAELAGFGNSCDAYQMLSPHPEGTGILLAANRAMQRAEVSAEDVEYVNAHGTGTRLNDKYETVAFRRIFGKNIPNIRVSSTKPITGHLLGACGAIEAIVCILSIQHGFIPPIINYFHPDPECELNFVQNKSENKDVSVTMSFTYGFGGKNSVLIFRKVNNLVQT